MSKTNDFANNDILDTSDLINWRDEAAAVIEDVRAHVHDLSMAERLPCSRTHIHLNLTTLEEHRFCVRMNGEGFRVVGLDHDSVQEEEQESITYETPYALLGALSSRYTQSFGNLLSNALGKLEEGKIDRNESVELLQDTNTK